MADLLRPQGPKKNHKKGILAASRDRKRAEAESRNLSYSKLTKAEKLAKLDAGGYTATRQRTKLSGGN